MHFVPEKAGVEVELKSAVPEYDQFAQLFLSWSSYKYQDTAGGDAGGGDAGGGDATWVVALATLL